MAAAFSGTRTFTTNRRPTRPRGSAPYLHFGCLSPAALARRLRGKPRAEHFLRQLCWRDFYTQLLWAKPSSLRESMKGTFTWRDDREGLEAWKDGRTGYPFVDAAMRASSCGKAGCMAAGVWWPTLQGQRHDPSGDYVRRYVQELAGVEGSAVHDPNLVHPELVKGYPEPLVEHAAAVERFRAAR